MFKIVFAVFAALSFVSCQEGNFSPEVEKYEEQQLELEAVEKELAEVRAKSTAAKTDGPEIPVADLKAKLAKAEASVTQLNQDVKTLKESEKKALKDLAAYKAKYSLQE
ncbi:MAG: DNA repair exonuclease SbcCD ATPase subunit [Akkermansiaceae bacterium]|jgi:DNA repair exonuclease SbcCD ATPase subunit